MTAPRTIGVRSTKQRSAISELLETVDEFRSAQELHDELRKRGDGIGLTTVYRTLQLMVDAEQLDAIRTDDGETAYRRCSTGHHHHLVCRGCGRTVEVEGPAIETWTDQIAAEHGFTQVEHQLEIFGLCGDCKTS